MSAIGAGRPRPRIFGATPTVGRPARIQSRFLSPIQLAELYNFAIMHFRRPTPPSRRKNSLKFPYRENLKLRKLLSLLLRNRKCYGPANFTSGFLRVSRSASWVLDFCTQPGRRTTRTSGSTGSRGAAPARRPAGP